MSFAQTLTRLRRDAGFHTPYAYYHRNGGRRVFPFTFAYYLKLERGKHLPRPEWLPLLLALLRVPPTDEMHRLFVLDYLKDLFVTEETFRSLVAPLLRDAVPAPLASRAAKRLIQDQAYHLTEAQCRGLIAEPAAYWAFECLVNDRGSFTAEELAEPLGLPEAVVARGLKRLAALKLAKRAVSGRWKSPLAGKYYVMPMAFPGYAALHKRFAGMVDAMIARRGVVLHESGVTVRTDEASMRRAVSALRDALESASAYSTHDKAEGSGIFFLQTRVRKAFDF